MPSILQAVQAVTGLLGLAGAAAQKTVGSTVLILGRDDFDVAGISPGLDAYGIPWQKALIPQAGANLPTLNSSATNANYGSIILIGSISYDYNGTYRSALTDAQWNQIYGYQTTFGVRMVRINEYPGPNFGTYCCIARHPPTQLPLTKICCAGATPYNPNNPGCCDNGVVAGISIPSTTLIPGANIKA